jgi:EAL domain-containing protein (putative c-di-GMP-specific phosphodiesterase class I)
MGNIDRAARQLGAIKKMGVRLAIDDFGTGYSSLQVLTRLPVDVLKIDRSFIQDLALNERHRLVVQTTITLAKSFGLKTVAEGVETEVHANSLRELGCDVLQGYLIHRPAPAGVIGRWLGSHGRHVASESGEALTERPNARSRR